MAPHDTNTPKEARRHKTPLITLALILVALVIGLIAWGLSGAGDETVDPDAAEDAAQPGGG